MTVHHRDYEVMLWQPARMPHQRGFTLIELIMVIVLLGVLAVFAAPRIFNSNDFNARGFHDETLSFLRYAQKTAIAQRRTVCVAFAGMTGATLSIASLPATPTCNTALRGPKGDSPGTLTAKPGVAYNGPPISFNFDGLGQPIDAAGALVATQTIQIGNAANVIVEAGTGYVHE
ncbi:pilus assembly FimT family protein [Rhodoferax sp. UBA5149]|uniref:pilus assembly FimT family protein n=1 Tax=Rhodoferax sp. UBA5149 TaxID=1947379 RepID=UPI0025D1D775|nr:type II secretion system protein [Rhodoferax sp. UBA5149]